MKTEDLITTIDTLGDAVIPSPLASRSQGGYTQNFVADHQRITYSVDPDKIAGELEANGTIPSFEKAGPREKIYFDPSKLKCAIVTCGGLCPGLNDIIRSVFLELHHCYGVRHIYGIKYGLQGFIPKYGHDIVTLTPGYVSQIMDMGGTVLGSSRGTQDMDAILDCMERLSIGILFMVGGGRHPHGRQEDCGQGQGKSS